MAQNNNNLALFESTNTASPWLTLCAASLVMLGATASAQPLTISPEGAIAIVKTGGSFKVKSQAEAKLRFRCWVDEWKQDTRYESRYSKIVSHPRYRAILGLGEHAVPLILEELRKGKGGVWFQTLVDLTQENPVPAEHAQNPAKVREYWLKWGMSNGLI